MLKIFDLRKSYPTPQGPLMVLKGGNLTLEPGSSLALMGESGRGKSTLLHLIAGLDAADSGEIRLHAIPCVDQYRLARIVSVIRGGLTNDQTPVELFHSAIMKLGVSCRLDPGSCEGRSP
jgi:ABC-type dipeptide/oligopeptide/nickel transport system ATPase subunit